MHDLGRIDSTFAGVTPVAGGCAPKEITMMSTIIAYRAGRTRAS